MADKSNNFDGQILIQDGNGTPGAPGGYFGFGRAGTASTGPRIYSVNSNPNGTLTAPRGSLALDRTNGGLFVNTNGGTTWIAVTSGGTLGPLADDQYLIMGNDSDGRIGYDSGADTIYLETDTRSAGPTADLGLLTGVPVNGSESGSIDIRTSPTNGADSGDINIETGPVAGGGGFRSGEITIRTGNASSNTTAPITIQTGNGTAGNTDTAEIVLQTGSPSGSGVQGSLIVNTRQIVPPAPVTGAAASAPTVATPITYIVDVADIATGTFTVPLPYPIELFDVVVSKRGSAGDPGNRIELRNGATTLTDNMVLPTNVGEVVRNAATATNTGTVTSTTLTVAVTRAGGSSSCRMYLTGVRRNA